MDESFIFRITQYAVSQARPIPYQPASEKDIEEAEARLKLSIPPLLRSVYLQVGNGGFGPGRGGCIIGVKGGYTSDFGTLVETFEQLQSDQKSEGKTWSANVLPFCEWGCNIFSCVDCKDPPYSIYLFEEGDMRLMEYNLQDFFNMWTGGIDILSYEGKNNEETEITNPFTGEKTRVVRQKRK